MQETRRKRGGFDPCIRKISWRRKRQPTPVQSHGQRSLVGYIPLGCRELNVTKHTYIRARACAHTHTHTHRANTLLLDRRAGKGANERKIGSSMWKTILLWLLTRKSFHLSSGSHPRPFLRQPSLYV